MKYGYPWRDSGLKHNTNHLIQEGFIMIKRKCNNCGAEYYDIEGGLCHACQAGTMHEKENSDD